MGKNEIMVYLEDAPYITLKLELVTEYDGLTTNSFSGVVVLLVL